MWTSIGEEGGFNVGYFSLNQGESKSAEKRKKNNEESGSVLRKGQFGRRKRGTRNDGTGKGRNLQGGFLMSWTLSCQ